MSAMLIGVVDSVRLVGVVGEGRERPDLDFFAVDRKRPWGWERLGRSGWLEGRGQPGECRQLRLSCQVDRESRDKGWAREEGRVGGPSATITS
jgi:hypothetical protein